MSTGASYLQDFLEDTAFERYVLERALPLVARDAVSTSGTYYVAEDRMEIALGVHDTIGMTLDEAVESLGIRPLVLGAAWKVVDLLLEHALPADGHQPSDGRRWRIDEKIRHATLGHGRAMPLSTDTDVWSRLMSAYAALEEVRHSLVHRRATLGQAGEIVGVDRNGVPLASLRPAEQEDFCRAVQRAVDALTSGAMDARGRNALLWHLDRMGNVTGLASAGAYEPGRIPRIELRVDLAQDVDWPKIKAKLTESFGAEVDVVLVTAIGDRLFAHLEDAPDEEARLDLGEPPPWIVTLTRR